MWKRNSRGIIVWIKTDKMTHRKEMLAFFG